MDTYTIKLQVIKEQSYQEVGSVTYGVESSNLVKTIDSTVEYVKNKLTAQFDVTVKEASE